MGCVCCSLSSFVSIVLDSLERISMCTMCALLTCCLLFTILAVLILGIGIGYHYCSVSNSVQAMSSAANSAGSLRSGDETQKNVMRSVDKVVKRGFAHRISRREVKEASVENNINSSLHHHNITAKSIANTTNYI